MNKVFMDFMEDDFFKEMKFDVNTFVKRLGDIDKMSSFDVLDKISCLKKENREIIFNNEKIRNKIRYGLLCESKDNQ